MSKPRRIADFERTAKMLDLVHRFYPEQLPTDRAMSLSHVVVEECAPGTGFRHAQRWADVLALGMWPSDGLALDGYEIKASRADLKKELSDLSKHWAIALYCDSWTLVAWDESILVDGIPDDWGIWLTKEVDGERELVQHRKPAKRTPEPWPRAFVCALVRNAFEQSPSAAYIARACSESNAKGRREGEDVADARWEVLIAPLTEALYGTNSWKWPKEARDPEKFIRVAADKLRQGALPLEARA